MDSHGAVSCRPRCQWQTRRPARPAVQSGASTFAPSLSRGRLAQTQRLILINWSLLTLTKEARQRPTLCEHRSQVKKTRSWLQKTSPKSTFLESQIEKQSLPIIGGGKKSTSISTRMSREFSLESRFEGQLKTSNMLPNFSIFNKKEQEFYFFPSYNR